MAENRIYMDWNASAPLCNAAREACLSVLERTGNPSSVHGEGRAIRAAIESARRDVAALCSASAAHVVFTSGATEAANLVLTPDFRMGKADLSMSRLYVSAIEHPAVREGGRFAPSQVTEIPVLPSGATDLAALESLLVAHDSAAGLPMAAIMLANNETGILQPVSQAARLVHAAGGVLVVDAVQAAGRIVLDIEALGADFLILSSHKIGGPKGAGALVGRGEVLMPAALLRGGGQEKGHRAGTENAVAIAGFGAATQMAARNINERAAAIAMRRDRLEQGLQRIAQDVIVHGQDGSRLCNTSFFSLGGLPSETGQIAFDLEGVALSSGAACSSGKVGQSHVLRAMGLDPRLGALRISIGDITTDAEIDFCLQAFAKIAARRKRAVIAA